MLSKIETEKLEHLFDLASAYFIEDEGDGIYKIPDGQHERSFIQEVLSITGEILEGETNDDNI